EAFYFTVKDPNATSLSIRELLEQYALNPERRGELDIESDPDLPYKQEELGQYYWTERPNQLQVSFYVNRCPTPGPAALSAPAQSYLSTCTYHDGSYDYRLLDLVLVSDVRDFTEVDLTRVQEKYGAIFLLLFMGQLGAGGHRSMAELTDHEAAAFFLGAAWSTQFRPLNEDLKTLESQGMIEKKAARSSVEKPRIELTEKGTAALEALEQEIQTTAERYNAFDSVGIAPPALGVPDGFDARVQMMDIDGVEKEKAVLLQVIDQNRDQLFGKGIWYDAYSSFAFFEDVRAALAYQTHFSRDVIDELRALAGNDA
ncbi:MAG: hypothetical protein AAF492_32645, partial [Verrucomicrobiota bacterium]